jgi:hypothetical protein
MVATNNMHKSKDGVWRPCGAKKVGCPLGHASVKEVRDAGTALSRIGFGRESVKSLDVRAVKALADKERAYTNANTPAWALGSEKQLPPVGVVQEMPRREGFSKNPLWRSVSTFVRENKVTGEVEVLSEEHKTLYGRSSATAVKKMKASLKYEDKMGHQRILEFEYEEEAYEKTVSPDAAIIKYYIQSVYYRQSLEAASEKEAVASLAKRKRIPELSAHNRIQKAKETYENLRDFIGQDTLDAMSKK